MLRKFFISIVRSLIVIILLTFIFSMVSVDFGDLIKDIFGGIYEYTSPEVQKQVVSNLAESCLSLGQGSNLLTFDELCNDRNLMNSMRENCREYRALKRKNIKIDNEEGMRETCEQLESGEIERICDELQGKESLLPDFRNMETLCRDYDDGKVSDKEFFSNFIGSSFGGQEMDLPKFEAFEKYDKIVRYLDDNKIIYVLILAILIAVLYLLFMDITLFLLALSGISFSIGFFILLPYFGILAYDNYVGIDTTPILGSLFGGGDLFDLKGIISLILILFLKLYNSFIITFIFLVIGIIGKVYGFISKRKPKEKIKGGLKEIPEKELKEELKELSKPEEVLKKGLKKKPLPKKLEKRKLKPEKVKKQKSKKNKLKK